MIKLGLFVYQLYHERQHLDEKTTIINNKDPKQIFSRCFLWNKTPQQQNILVLSTGKEHQTQIDE